jgi:CRISPR/Cas system CMR-associated protein Cmr5 small subunit
MKIKYLFIIVCLSGCSLTFAQNNTFGNLFDKYENEDDVTVVSISKAMFKMIPNNISTGNVDIKDIVPKIESLLILTSDKKYMKEKMYSDFKKITENDKSYEELMRIKDGKTNVTFNAKKSGDIIKELIMIVNEEENFVAIQILGNFTIEDVQKITKEKTQ